MTIFNHLLPLVVWSHAENWWGTEWRDTTQLMGVYQVGRGMEATKCPTGSSLAVSRTALLCDSVRHVDTPS